MAINADGSFKSWPPELDEVMWGWWNHLLMIDDLVAHGVMSQDKADALIKRKTERKDKEVDKFYGRD